MFLEGSHGIFIYTLIVSLYAKYVYPYAAFMVDLAAVLRKNSNHHMNLCTSSGSCSHLNGRMT
jgi:hypothetical protein